MIYTSAAESVAEIILKQHKCGPDCVCWNLRKVPAVNEEIRRLHAEKLHSTPARVKLRPSLSLSEWKNHTCDGKAGPVPQNRPGYSPDLPNLVNEIQTQCSHVRRAIPEYEEAWFPSESFARRILLALIDEGEASIKLGDVKRMTKALAELRGIRSKNFVPRGRTEII